MQRAQVDARDNGDRVSNMTRAEKFEDEKKRIVESCFSKRDEDGSCMLSLIRGFDTGSCRITILHHCHMLYIMVALFSTTE